VGLSGDPDAARVVHALCLSDGIKKLIHKIQTKVTLLEKHPTSLVSVCACVSVCVQVERKKDQQKYILLSGIHWVSLSGIKDEERVEGRVWGVVIIHMVVK